MSSGVHRGKRLGVPSLLGEIDIVVGTTTSRTLWMLEAKAL
jgi:hypothetical protein